MRPRPALVLLVALALPALASCGGGEGGGSAERPSLSASVTPTRSVPSPTLSRTQQPPASDSASPSRSRSPVRPSPSRTRTQEPPSPTKEKPPQTVTASATVTQSVTPSPTGPRPIKTVTETAAPTETVSATPTRTPSASSERPTGQTEAGGVAPWVWWLLALAVVAGAVGLLVWVRRRRAWRRRFEEAAVEVTWLARELLPQLRESGSRDRVVGGWQVASPRVVAAEDQLTELASSGPERDRARAAALRDVVRDTRAHLDAYSVAAPPGDVRADLDGVVTRLEAALAEPARDE